MISIPGDKCRSIRGSVLRSTRQAWNTTPNTSFAGVEVSILPLFALGARLGAFYRLRTSNHKGLSTADLSFAL